MFWFLIFILFIYATERDIYDIIKNQPVVEPKSSQEFVVGVYLHKPDHVDISRLYDTLPMKTQAGLDMTCLVPKQHENGTLALSGEKPLPKKEKNTQTKEEFFKEHFKLRKSCFNQRKEYWSYEVCQDSINQFHGSGRSPLFELGRFDGFVDESRPEHKKLVLDLGRKWPPAGASYGYTVYLNGKDGRQTLVGWFCSTKDMIGKIDEPRTHRYYIEVYWTKLCEYDGVESTPVVRDPSDLASYLSALDKNCIKANQGWWTYELCYGKRVRQYHEERTRNKKTSLVETKITVDYTLGKAKKPQKLSLQTFSGKKGSNYVEETYDQGTLCDITEEPRMITVRYKCMIDSKVVTVKPPDEVSSCIYTMDVAVPALCEHPDFKTHHKPASEIVCYPKGMDKPPTVTDDKEDADSEEEEAVASTDVMTAEDDLTSLLGDILSGGDIQNLIRNTGGITTINVDIDPDDLEEIMNDPTRLDELIEQATEGLDFDEFLDEESSVPALGDEEDEDEMAAEALADESIDDEEDSDSDKEEL